MKRFWAGLLCMVLTLSCVAADQTGIAYAEEAQKESEQIHKEKEADGAVELSAPSAILMEASTGQVIYEKNCDEKRPPASVTKVMTLLLIFDALKSEKIHLEDEVSVSEYAASMGGSQVFLEPNETQTVDTLIKCIAVASANDACVAMAEYIAGDEGAFVDAMNKRAKALKMTNTHFENCNGLDKDGHETTARDIALMSRELITNYPQIYDYCNIWMEDITHKTKKGTTTFGLSNTNKLIRHYEYATGLKTGSTGKAKFCISATAKKDDVDLIAVIMAAEDSKKRNKDAVTLLNYGFGRCQKYEEKSCKKEKEVPVKRGVEKTVKTKQKKPFLYVDTTGADLSEIKREVVLNKKLNAPVEKGEKAGVAEYYLGDKKIGCVDIVAVRDIREVDIKSVFEELFRLLVL